MTRKRFATDHFFLVTDVLALYPSSGLVGLEVRLLPAGGIEARFNNGMCLPRD